MSGQAGFSEHAQKRSCRSVDIEQKVRHARSTRSIPQSRYFLNIAQVCWATPVMCTGLTCCGNWGHCVTHPDSKPLPFPLALAQPTFVGLGRIVDGIGDAHGSDQCFGISAGSSPTPVLLVVGENRCPHARATGTEVKQLHSEGAPTSRLVRASCLTQAPCAGAFIMH